MTRYTRSLAAALAAVLVLAGCSKDETKESSSAVTLVTHSSFSVSDDVVSDFKKKTGLTLKISQAGDAGAALNQAILTKGDPLGDVFFGVDNTLMTKALDAELFEEYRPPALSKVPSEFRLDETGALTPVDFGDVCVNYDKSKFTTTPPPESLEDLADPLYKGKLVVPSPATSSPGLAFLLSTIKKSGDDWQDYWRRLKANDVLVVDGWEQAYNTEYSAGPGAGNRPLVVSYGSSPPAEVQFADPPIERPNSGVMETSCFRQIEFAGVLKGAGNPDGARKLIEFMLTKTFQDDVALQMFVYPVSRDAEVPEVFERFAVIPQAPLELNPRDIGKNREKWIRQWDDIVEH